MPMKPMDQMGYGTTPVPVVPGMVDAYTRDPRLKMAQALMQSGSSTAPVMGMWDGLARAAQGAAGAFMEKRVDKQYQQQQKDYMDQRSKMIAAILGSQAQPQQAPVPPSPMPQAPQGAPTAPPMPGSDPNRMADLNGTVAGLGGPPGAPQPGGPPPMPQGAPSQPPGDPSAQGLMNPGMPQMPKPPGGDNDSMRLKLGLALLGGNNPWGFNEGLQDTYAGVAENAQSKAENEARQWEASKAQYNAELNDRASARDAARGDYYGARTSDRALNNAMTLQTQQQGYDANQKDLDRALQFREHHIEQYGEDLPMDQALTITTGNKGAGDYFNTLINITANAESGGKEFDAHGNRITSPKGAMGIMQVMPATAAKPGYGINPSDGTPEDDARVGKELFGKLLVKYGGDPAKAWAAYNAGPGRLDKALASGGDWRSKLPTETRQYVANNMAALGQARTQYTAQFGDRIPGKTLEAQKLDMYKDWGGTNKNQHAFGSGTRPLPAPQTKDLNSQNDLFTQLHDLHDGYRANYQMPVGVNAFGDALIKARGDGMVSSVMGDSEGVNWWNDYNKFINKVRNGEFGSALTAQEIKQFSKEAVGSSDSAAKMQHFLKKWLSYTQQSLQRKARGYGTVFSSDEISGLLGDNVDRLNDYSYMGGKLQNTATKMPGATAQGTMPPGLPGMAPPIQLPGQQGKFVRNPDGSFSRIM